MNSVTSTGESHLDAAGRGQFGRASLVVLKVLVLGVLLLLAHLVSSALVGVADAMPPSWTAASPTDMLAGVAVGSLLYSVALSYVVVRSSWAGWRLVLALFWAVFGLGTLLTHIETVLFLQHLTNIIPPALVPKLIAQGTVFAAFVALLTSLVHGRLFRRPGKDLDAPQPADPQRTTLAWWGRRLAAVAVAYIVLYLGAGMLIFVPLAGPAVGEYYSNLQMPVWILLVQAGRALIWAAVALPVIKMIRGPWWVAGLGVALIFSLLMSAFMLGPNPLMPDRIRLSHFAELTVSNFIFGWVVAWLLRERRSPSTPPSSV